MPELIAQALATDGFIWLALAALVAGTVRGFSGFGAALVYLPFAGQILPPVEAIFSLMVMDAISPLPALPRAVREAHWPDLRKLVLGLVVGTPLGVMLLMAVSGDVFRYTVSLVSLAVLAALMLGLRYQGQMSAPKVAATGVAGGVLGGAVGIPGPPVILFYLASTQGPAITRATILLFLLGFDLIFCAVAGVQGLLNADIIVLGLCLAPASLIGMVLGTWLFRPGHERVYRAAAYCIIGVSAIRGLPIWGG